MKKLSKVSMVVGLLLAFSGQQAFSAGHYATGNMYNVSSIADGFIFQLDQPGPDNCEGKNAYLIKAEHKAMIAVAMTKWAQKDPWVTVYTDGLKDGWICVLNQFQPW